MSSERVSGSTGPRAPASSAARRWLVPASLGVAILAGWGLVSWSGQTARSVQTAVERVPAAPQPPSTRAVACPVPSEVAVGRNDLRLELREPAPQGLRVELTSRGTRSRTESHFVAGKRELVLEGLEPGTSYAGFLVLESARVPLEFTTLTGGAIQGSTVLVGNLAQDGGFTVASRGRQVVVLWAEPGAGGVNRLAVRESADAGKTWSDIRPVEQLAGRCDSLALAISPGGLWAAWRSLPGDRSSPVQLRLWPGPTTAAGPVLPMSLGLNVTSFAMLPAATRAVDVYACLVRQSGTARQVHQVHQIHVTEGAVGGLTPRRVVELEAGVVLMASRFAHGQGLEFGFVAALRESLLGLHWTAGPREGSAAWPPLRPLTARDEWTGGIDVAVGPEHVVVAYEEGSVRPLIQGKIVIRRCSPRGGEWSAALRVCGTASPPLLAFFRGAFCLAHLEGASERRVTLDLWTSRDGSDWTLAMQRPLPEPPSGNSQAIQLAATPERLLFFEYTDSGKLLVVPLDPPRR